MKKNLKDIKVSSDQNEHEFQHLLKKLAQRDKSRYHELKGLVKPLLHPLFKAKKGGLELWERVTDKTK